MNEEIQREVFIDETGEVLSVVVADESDIPEMMEMDELSSSVVYTDDEWMKTLECNDTNVLNVFCESDWSEDLVATIVFSAFRMIGGTVEKLIVHPSCNRRIVAAFLFDEILKQFQRDEVHAALTYKIHAMDDEFENNEELIRSVGVHRTFARHARNIQNFWKGQRMSNERAKDWHERRREFVGASEVAAILGLSPYSKPFDVWAVKKGIVEPFKGNEATRLGQTLESSILDHAEGVLGNLDRDVEVVNETRCGVVQGDAGRHFARTARCRVQNRRIVKRSRGRLGRRRRRLRRQIRFRRIIGFRFRFNWQLPTLNAGRFLRCYHDGEFAGSK